MEEAAAGKKTRLPTVDSLTDGTMRGLVPAERRNGGSVDPERRRRV